MDRYVPEDHRIAELEDTVLGGRYRLLRVLARGGMADVWQAVDERLRRQVAVKVLREDPDAPDDEIRLARRRFAVESRVVARLNHPKVIPVFDAGRERGISYLVMQQLSGRTLRDRMREGPLADHEVRRLAHDVLGALDAAHDAGLIHRDIKPGNILVDTDGGWKVADFGIAKSDDIDDDPSEVTGSGVLVCTPRYTAPERFAGQSATRSSDIYSVGVVLGEALAGRDDVDSGLLRVASRAAAPNPARRFGTAGAMIAALDADQEETTQPVPFRPAGAPRTSTRAEAARRPLRFVPDVGARTPLVATWGVLLLLITGFAVAVGDREQRGGAAGALLAPPAEAVAAEAVPTAVPLPSEVVPTTVPLPSVGTRVEATPAEAGPSAGPEPGPEAARDRERSDHDRPPGHRGRAVAADRSDGEATERDDDGDRPGRGGGGGDRGRGELGRGERGRG